MRIFFQLAISILALVILTPKAHAYLDPGTGSILLQGLLAVIAGAAVTLKVYWGKLKGLFVRNRVAAADEPDQPGEAPADFFSDR